MMPSSGLVGVDHRQARDAVLAADLVELLSVASGPMVTGLVIGRSGSA